MAAPEPTRSRLEAIRQRSNAATPGAWRIQWTETTYRPGSVSDLERIAAGEVPVRITAEGDRVYTIPTAVEDIVSATGAHVVCFGHDYDEYGRIAAVDAEFIVHARDDIPWLLAEVARLEQERDDARYQLGWTKPEGCPAVPLYTNIRAERNDATLIRVERELKAALAELTRLEQARDHELGWRLALDKKNTDLDIQNTNQRAEIQRLTHQQARLRELAIEWRLREKSGVGAFYADEVECMLGTAKGATMPEQIPTIGRIVHYRLSADDATQINRRRTTGQAISDRIANGVQGAQWPLGAQAHIGNDAKEGDTFPMLITKVWGDTPTSAVNGQAFLDGNDVLWITSAMVGEGPRTFSWPTRG